MEIREVTTYDPKLPFSGYGVWVVFELKYRKVLLIHPVHLCELMLTEYEYIRAVGKSLWPVNNSGTSFNIEKFKATFTERIKWYIESKRDFPLQTIARVLAELRGTSIEAAIKFIGSLNSQVESQPTNKFLSKANREYGLKKDADLSHYEGRRSRPKAIIEVLQENGPASIYQITNLVKGKLKTKCDLGRTVTYFVHKLTTEGILEII